MLSIRVALEGSDFPGGESFSILVDERVVKPRVICFLFGSLIAAGQTLTSTPTALSFTWTAGALPVAQTISIKGGSSTAAYTTALAPLGTQWITITGNATGTLPAVLSVLVNPSEMAVGVYVVDVVVSATGFANPVTIPVTLTVLQPLPTLMLSATSLNFITPPDIPPSQTLTLTTTGGAVTFGATVASAPWLTVSPSSGVVLPGFPLTLTVSVNDAGYSPSGTAYSGKITIVAANVASNATQTVAVSMLVEALTPTITNLYPSAALVGSGAVTVTVTGTGFYKGGTTAIAGVTPLATPTYVNPTTILVVLPVSVLVAAGPINVAVVNPAPGGVSAPSVFTVSLTPVVQAVVNAASYASAAISPGEFVTLFGTGIGPATPAGMTIVAGYASFTLGNASVTIDGQPAAMIYASANQITVQVPYEVTIGTGKVVAVTNNSVSEAYLPNVTTTATAPGLFLTNGVSGQCAALRYAASNGAESVNSSSSLALVGDVIVFYLTGEGIYDLVDSPADGYIVPVTESPLPQLNPLPSVTIGGVAATVQYAGPVPGGLLGLLQVNAVVPAGTTTGNSVPVSITIGSGVTQAGATIAVK
jgi:uncharacterized protein (TIGR03437 family)